MTPEELKAIRERCYPVHNGTATDYTALKNIDIQTLLTEVERSIAQRKKFSEEDYQIGIKDGTLLANEALKQEIKVLKATVERLTRRIEIAPIRVDESVAGWAEAQEKDSSITAEDIYSKVGGVGSVATHFSKKIEEYYPPDRTVEDAVDEAWEKNRGSGNG